MKRLVGELIFVAGLAASLWLVLHLGLKPVGHALASVGVGGILLVTLAHLPTLGALGLSWWLLARDAAGARPAKFVWGRLMRDAGGELLPFSQVGGFALGARAVALTGVSGVEAAVTSLLDVAVEQAAKAPYTLAAVGFLLWLAPGSAFVWPSLVVLWLNFALIAVSGTTMSRCSSPRFFNGSAGPADCARADVNENAAAPRPAMNDRRV